MTLTPGFVRVDIKCGNGSISQGEKCHKGNATQKAVTAGSVGRAVGLVAAGVGVGLGAIALGKTAKGQRAASQLLASAKKARYAPSNFFGRRRIKALKNKPMPQAMTVREATGMGPHNKFVDPWDPTPAAPPVPKVLRRFAKRDAVWADGFSPGLDQLVI